MYFSLNPPSCDIYTGTITAIELPFILATIKIKSHILVILVMFPDVSSEGIVICFCGCKLRTVAQADHFPFAQVRVHMDFGPGVAIKKVITPILKCFIRRQCVFGIEAAGEKTLHWKEIIKSQIYTLIEHKENINGPFTP